MNIMTKNTVAAFALFVSLVACASEPVLNVNPERHGNLAAAQQSIRTAFNHLSDAQQANHEGLGGHAARAKELLREAADEVKLAAETANHH